MLHIVESAKPVAQVMADLEAATGSGHHREAVLVFPPHAAAEALRIVVKNVGGVAERSFSWELLPAR